MYSSDFRDSSPSTSMSYASEGQDKTWNCMFVAKGEILLGNCRGQWLSASEIGVVCTDLEEM